MEKEKSANANTDGENAKELDNAASQSGQTPPNRQNEGDYHRLYLEARKNSDELLTRLKYMQADYENFKKRALKEKLEIIEIANESLLSDLLTVLDEMDAAISHLPKDAGMDGIGLVRQNMLKTLGEYGLQQMKVKAGDDFNPDACEAIGTENTADQKNEGKISLVAQRGYMLRGLVLRFAKVKVYMFEKG